MPFVCSCVSTNCHKLFPPFAAEELENIELSFEGLSSAEGLLGHGGFVCYGTNFKPRSEVLGWMRFFRDESCGKCTPCRIGTQRALELLQRIGTDLEKEGDRTLLADLDDELHDEYPTEIGRASCRERV